MRLLPVVLLLAACARQPAADDVRVLPEDTPLPLDASVEARVDTILAETAPEVLATWMTGDILAPLDGAWTTPGDEVHGLPGFRMSDGPRGMTLKLSTVFPVAMSRAASWDVGLEEEIGRAIGAETIAHGNTVLLAPCINVVRHPRWGRSQESYGEDPVLLGALGVAFTRGAQEHVLATAKHFAANSVEDTRYEVDVSIDPRTLREVYLPHFRELVRGADLAAIMSAYNQVNGDYTGESKALLRDVLVDDWGFQGIVMSDWMNGVYDGPKALAAGQHLEMPVPDAYETLPDLVRLGQVDVDDVLDGARRIARRQLEYGLDTLPVGDPSVIRSAAHFALARRAAVEGTVLLKNDGDLLPLDAASLTDVVLLGRLAATVNTGDDGSSNPKSEDEITPAAGLTDALGADVVTVFDTDTPDATALDAAAAADVVVVVVGLTAADESEWIDPGSAGDRETLALSDAHQQLIRDAAAANPNVIVVLEGGSAITVEGWIDDVPTLLHAWYPGQEGGAALADLILGVVAPSGRLPLAVPRDEADLTPFDNTSLAITYGYLHGYRWLDRQGTAPRFPFGFGLSTTTFSWDAIDGDAALTDTGDEGTLTVQVTLTNTGARDADQVVQVYAEPVDPSVELPDRILAGFARVSIDAGATVTASVTVPERRFAVWDEDRHAFVVPAGTWRLLAGPHEQDLPLEHEVTVGAAE